MANIPYMTYMDATDFGIVNFQVDMIDMFNFRAVY